MARENKSLYALLGILSLGPCSGYEIKKFIEGSLIHFWQEGYGQIYPNLKKLVDEELATVQAQKQEGKPDKKIYQITAKGKQKLHQWLTRPIEHLPPQKIELLLKLFFSHDIPPEGCIAHIQRHREKMVETLNIYESIEAVLTSKDCTDPNTAYSFITLDYGKKTTESVINWCDESIEILRKMKNRED